MFVLGHTHIHMQTHREGKSHVASWGRGSCGVNVASHSEKDLSLITHWIIYTVEGRGKSVCECVCLCMCVCVCVPLPLSGAAGVSPSSHPWFMCCILTCKQKRGGWCPPETTDRANMEGTFYSGSPPSWTCPCYIHREASNTYPDQMLNHLNCFFSI